MKSLFNILKSKKNESSVMRGAHAALTLEEVDKIIAEIFGADAMNYIQAAYCKNGILGIRCQSSSSSLEVKMREQEILAKISEKINDNSLVKIKILP